MQKLNTQRVGLTVGSFAGLWHLIWSILVALGWAQPLTDWIVNLHMVTPTHQVQAFDLGTAIMLVIVTTVVGYVIGSVFAVIWNSVHNG